MLTHKIHQITLMPIVIVLALLASACSGSVTTAEPASEASTTSNDSDPTESSSDAEPTAVPAPTSAAEPTAIPAPTEVPTPEPTPPPATPEIAATLFPTGTTSSSCAIPDGDSFEIVDCDQAHRYEVFAVGQFSDQPDDYPGQAALQEAAFADGCTTQGEAFLGGYFEGLIDTIVPSDAAWQSGDRSYACAIVPGQDDTKLGTAAGGTIETDAVLLSRAGLASDGVDFDDWILLRQGQGIYDIGSLSDGQFDLPLRAPKMLDARFLFAARPAGSDSHENTVWGYNFIERSFIELGVLRPGSEVAEVTTLSTGRLVFAAREEDSDWDLFVARPDIDETVALADGPGDQHFASVTPDEQRVVYYDEGNLWIVDIDGSNRTQLTDGGSDWESTVSPDGTTILFTSERSGNEDIWSMGIDGSNPVNLTNHPGGEAWPSFSPDGELIFFGTDRLDPESERLRTMVMNADGSNQTWFGGVNSSWAVVVDDARAEQWLRETPSLLDRYEHTLVEGEPGTTSTYTTSSGRVSLDLPAGWRVAEYTDGSGLVAGWRPEAYFQFWDVDAVAVTLLDDFDEDGFFAEAAQFDAVTLCERVVGDDQVRDAAVGVRGVASKFDCGENSIVGIIALYNTETQVGIVIEGQRDALPTAEADDDILDAIARSIVWN